MARLLSAGVLVLVLAASVVAGGTVAALDADDGPAGSDVVADAGRSVQSQGFDQTVFSIEVYENGSARWTFSYRQALANDSEQQRFEAYAERFESNPTETYRDFRGRAEALTTAGENETNRTMNATDFQRRAYVSNLGNQGIVEMSFLWRGFARTDGARVIAGDVFEGGLYVGPDQRFVVGWGDGIQPLSVAPAATQTTEDTIVYEGGEDGRQFLDGQPEVVFTTATNGTAGTDGVAVETTTPNESALSGATTPSGTSAAAPSETVPLWPLAVGVILVVGGIGLAISRGVFDPRRGDRPSEPADPSPDTVPATSTGSRPAPGPSEPAPEPASGSDADPAVPDEEFMTDEDRVFAMLDANGGRMKQVDIVESSEWSKSKVSMLLTEMEEAGQISKLRVGRENIISRAGDEPSGSSVGDDE
jgi:hypothetical protein